MPVMLADNRVLVLRAEQLYGIKREVQPLQ